jgi:hypothetical protein
VNTTPPSTTRKERNPGIYAYISWVHNHHALIINQLPLKKKILNRKADFKCGSIQ